MDETPFDRLARLLAQRPSRRALLPGLGALLAAPLAADARKKHKGNKKNAKQVTFCLDGQTLTVGASKKKQKKLRNQGANPGACPLPVCTPTCPGATCGGEDGCGGTCRCPVGSLCFGGICQACTIACTANDHVCDGTALQTTLSAGGTVFICPGRYTGRFAPGNVTAIGAGDGDDPATNTILDANRAGRVFNVVAGRSVTLQSIRVTGGAASTGAGVQNAGALAVTECTVTGNEATGESGGIDSAGSLTLTRCRITGNKAEFGGGIGLFNNGTATTTTLVRTEVSQNVATGSGGGVFVGNLTTLRVTDGSQITGNQAGADGGGIDNLGTTVFDASSSLTGNTSTNAPSGISRGAGTVTLNGAAVSGNSPQPQCTAGVGCP